MKYKIVPLVCTMIFILGLLYDVDAQASVVGGIFGLFTLIVMGVIKFAFTVVGVVIIGAFCVSMLAYWLMGRL